MQKSHFSEPRRRGGSDFGSFALSVPCRPNSPWPIGIVVVEQYSYHQYGQYDRSGQVEGPQRVPKTFERGCYISCRDDPRIMTHDGYNS